MSADAPLLKLCSTPEELRLQALDRCSIIGTRPEHGFDRFVFIAAQLCRTPMAMVALIDRARAWCKAAVGLVGSEIDREQSFCWQVVLQRQELLVTDATTDVRFATLEQVAGPRAIRFYSGFPLHGPDNHVLGALCVLDDKPRTITERQIRSMRHLALEASELIQLRVPGLDLSARPA